MRKFSREEVVILLDEALNNASSEIRESVLDSVHIAESRTGARLITITGDMLHNPENQAMLMALNSRESGGFVKNLSKVLSGGSGSFMEKFFIGYGHKSIGDCGGVPLWIDGLSMVAAKQFENWPLFSGQETSTRYVDITGAGWLNPLRLSVENVEGLLTFEKMLRGAFDFYTMALPRMKDHIRQRFPRKEEEKEALYENAVHARACDILGAFLPCGAKTNMSIVMNIRQMGEHLQQMSFDKLPEVALLAQDCIEFLAAIYPHSFPPKLYPGHAEYWGNVRQETAYFAHSNNSMLDDYPEYHFETNVSKESLRPWLWALRHRPKGCELPKEMRKLGSCRITHLQDYRSMRDGYRHRDGTNRIPSATVRFGFERWYLNQLFDELCRKAMSHLAEIDSFYREKVIRGSYDALSAQYIVPMGYKQPCERTLTFPATVYYVELRSGTTVHPTERTVALNVARSLRECFPDVILYVDESESEWDVKRGKDVITIK